MIGSSHCRLHAVLASALMLAISASGQTPGTGGIEGRVFDPAGLPIAAAHVLLVNESTKASRAVDTNAEGVFTASLLAPGSYDIAVQQPGLEENSPNSVLVSVGEMSFLNITLTVARVGLNVDVHTDAELMQTQSATLGRTVDNRAIQSLPLANRNFTQLLSLSPGVIVGLPDATTLGRNTQNVTAVGNKTTANTFQFNGIDANNLAQNSAKGNGDEVGLAIPAPDTIFEFKVQTANYDAGYGRGTGANVDLVSKAGTDQFHGSIWEYFRNDVFNANLFFLKKDGQPRPVLKQNQFGGSLGGPLL